MVEIILGRMKKKRENRENGLEGRGGEGRKQVELENFLPGPTKTQSPQIGEKIKEDDYLQSNE